VLFASLSVLAGEIDLDAAEKVSPSSEAGELVHLLTRLVDKSLVARVPAEQDQARYRLLESLRQFGRERLRAAGLEDDLRRRHAEHYLELAARAEIGIRGPEQGPLLDRLEADLDNLRAALEWGRDKDGMGLSLAVSMWWFWESRGYPSEGLEWLSEGLDADSGYDPAVRAKAQAVAASVALAMGDLEAGTRLARASHEAYARLDDPAGLSVATHILGSAARYASDYAEATRLLEEARRIAEEIGSAWDVAWALHHLGQVAGLVGDYTSAQRHHVRSLALYREAGDELGAGYSLWALGVVARYRGEYSLAEERCEEALRLLRKLRDRSGEAHARYTMGDVARLQGAYERAGALYRDSLEQLRRVGDKRCVASVLSNLALVSIEKDQLDEADRFLAESVELRHEAGDRAGLAECLERTAEVSHARGEHARAATLAAAAEAARATTASALPNPEKKRHERLVGSLRASLGPSTFSAAWERGASAGLERALDLAAEGGRLGAAGVPVRQ
ncbi:MAG: ATP-binding protein, partial [Actinomycetota bacterium]